MGDLPVGKEMTEAPEPRVCSGRCLGFSPREKRALSPGGRLEAGQTAEPEYFLSAVPGPTLVPPAQTLQRRLK